MLTLTLAGSEEFEPITVRFEHSLLALSDWEAEHKKAFFGRSEEKTPAETISYINYMLLDDDPPGGLANRLSIPDYQTIAEYINDARSATWFREDPQAKGQQEIITSELIYYWLVQFRIPFHPVETWHFNRLMTLIKIAGVKQSKPKKMSKSELADHYRKLNEQRRKELSSSG